MDEGTETARRARAAGQTMIPRSAAARKGKRNGMRSAAGVKRPENTNPDAIGRRRREWRDCATYPPFIQENVLNPYPTYSIFRPDISIYINKLPVSNCDPGFANAPHPTRYESPFDFPTFDCFSG
ncbi:hypothetical protein [Burkholderia guangdongensis]|uniref:hypothetical protein n=1 Tax=Burkholderia guangdongensis TaxID=1792500 RepID=UPI0015CE9FC1|nr:hypothetical protein [Burkholderia guangdongensis]